ncbi:MAG: peptidoglycan DD-metalloendopeptidase family protein [Dermatophilaceae bacterium]
MSWRKIAASAIGIALVGVLSSAPANADLNGDKAKADKSVQEIKDQLEGTAADLVDAFTRLQATQAQLPGAQAELDQARAVEAQAQARNDELAAALATAQANEAQAVKRLADNATSLASMQTTLDSLAADVFQGGQPSELAVAMGASSPDEFAAQMSLTDTVSSLTDETLRNLQTARADGVAQESYLAAVRAEIAALKVQAQEALDAAVVARADAQAAKDALDQLVAQQAALTQQIETKKAAEIARLQAAEAEQARLAAALAERARLEKLHAGQGNTGGGHNGGGSTSHGGYLNYPANGPITSEFGMRFHPILHYWKLHTGTDFGIACGTPVYATANGTIIGAGWNTAYGNRILIDHGIVYGVDLVTTYNHLSSIVKSGGSVSRGQLIGYSGTTGWSTGCHLHFETLEDGAFVNPRKWI